MFNLSILRGLLEAYAAGDTAARKILLDFLEEEDDPRLEAVRREAIDWDELARQLTTDPNGILFRYFPVSRRHGFDPHLRWQIDCARVGGTATPEVCQAVANARRRWLQDLFPEASD